MKVESEDRGYRATHGYLTMTSIVGIAATIVYGATGAWRLAAVSAAATICFATGARLVSIGKLARGVDVGIVLSSTLLLSMLTAVYVLFPDHADEGQTLIATAFYFIATAGFFARRYYHVLLVAVPASLLTILYFFVIARPEQFEVRNAILALTTLLLAVGSTFLFDQANTLRTMRAELQEANADLNKAMQIKDRFMANMSHEIRTPLSGMIGSANLLVREQPREDQRETIQALQRSGDSLLRIVEDILNISKLDAGEYEFEDQQMNLSETIRDVVALYRVPAHGKGVTLDVVVEPSIPDPIIGDHERLKQILGNLVSNAVKYTDEGVVTIHAGVERTAPWMLAITVRDTGIGIALEDQPRLFRLFEQLDSSYAKRHSGTGLGLAITKRLVESAGGSIHFESSPGIGTAFTVRLPLILPLEVRSTTIVQPATDARSTSRAQNPEASPPVRRPRVLLAEDEPINAAILTRSLESIDAVVAHAGNGREVIDQLAAFNPDIIIMDAQMPEMSGVEATWRIRSLAAPEADIPIIGLTAYSHEHDIQALLDAGMNECYTKPIELAVLEEALYRHLPGLFKQQVG